MFHRFPFDLRVMSCTHWKVAADTRHKGVGLIAERRLQAPLGRRDRGRAAPPPLLEGQPPECLGVQAGVPHEAGPNIRAKERSKRLPSPS
jgi:hypothetical protein